MQPLGKTACRLLKKLKIELPYDPVIQLLGIYPTEIKPLSRRDICTSVCNAALLTLAKIWKQPVSANRQMDKEDVVYTMEY